MSLVVASKSSLVKKQEGFIQSALQVYDGLSPTVKSVAMVSSAIILYQTEPTIRNGCLTFSAVALTCAGVSKLSCLFFSAVSKFDRELSKIGC